MGSLFSLASLPCGQENKSHTAPPSDGVHTVCSNMPCRSDNDDVEEEDSLVAWKHHSAGLALNNYFLFTVMNV